MNVQSAKLHRVAAILVFWLAAGCGPTPAEREFRIETDAIKQQFGAADIEAALYPIYLQGVYPDSPALTNRVPDVVRTLPIFSGVSNHVKFLPSGQSNHWGLMVYHDGGPVHRGLLYLPFPEGQSVVRKLQRERVIVIPWTNGIYFYDLLL